jgi:uncharacterized protein YjiS (DUF1127 family)
MTLNLVINTCKPQPHKYTATLHPTIKLIRVIHLVSWLEMTRATVALNRHSDLSTPKSSLDDFVLEDHPFSLSEKPGGI